MSFDKAGNLIITGSFFGTADFDGGPGVHNLTCPDLFSDIFILKLKTNGDFVWVKQVGGCDDDLIPSIALDASDNIFVTGSFSGTADFDPGANVYNLTSAATADKFIEKLDPDGNFLWVKQIGWQFASLLPQSIKIDKEGNVITTGYFRGTGNFDPGTGVYNLSAENNYATYILKLDNAGNFIWAIAINGNPGAVYARSLAVDDSNNIYTAGHYEGTADFDPGPNIYNLTSGSDLRFVLKVNKDGAFDWARNMSDMSTGISISSYGYIYVCGHLFDYSIMKLTTANDSVWRVSTGNEYTTVNAINVNTNGSIYTTGYFMDVTDFEPGPGVDNLIPLGTSGIFVHKLKELIPVAEQFISFTGSAIINGNQLNWTVPDDINDQQFEIDKSTDGISFYPIVMLPANVDSNLNSYSYIDTSFGVKVNYYRISHINQNHTTSLSGIVSIISPDEVENIINDISVSPNPSSHIVTIKSNHNFVNATIRLLI